MYIESVKNETTEGITLVLNEPTALNNGLKSKTWWVSWDKIGEALFKDQYNNQRDKK